MTACKIFSITDWKVGRETLIKWPKLEDTPYHNETLIKEPIQNSDGRKRACPVLRDFEGEQITESSELNKTYA